MTGQELLEGLSFIDGRFIAEAETASLHTATPRKRLLAAAACLCVLITGVFAYRLTPGKDAAEGVAAPNMGENYASTGAAPEAMANAQDRSEDVLENEDASQEISCVRLTIVEISSDGSFTATVEHSNTALAEVGSTITVVIDGDAQIDPTRLHPGALAEVQCGTYDTGEKILYAAQMELLCREVTPAEETTAE